MQRNAGIFYTKMLKQTDGKGVRHGWQDAQLDLAANFRLKRFNIQHRLFQLMQRPRDTIQQDLTCLGQDHATHVSAEQLSPDGMFQQLDLT